MHISSYANLVLLNRLYAQLERRAWTKARESFLKEELAKKSKLTCYYCNRDDLKLKSKRRCQQATVDHVIAKSLGGAHADKSNFVVCCDSCNRKKGSEELQNFLTSKYLQFKKKCHCS